MIEDIKRKDKALRAHTRQTVCEICMRLPIPCVTVRKEILTSKKLTNRFISSNLNSSNVYKYP